MARYVAALLGGGANEHGSILKPETLAAMFAPQYQPDPRVPGVGLAFYRGDVGGHLVVEKDGLVPPAFGSQISMPPGDAVGVVALTNGARGAHWWLGNEVSGILRQVLGVAEDGVRTDVAQHPEIWSDLCGWYAFSGSLRDVQKWLIAGAEVSVRRGRLTIRPLTPIPSCPAAFPFLAWLPFGGYDFNRPGRVIAATECWLAIVALYYARRPIRSGRCRV